MKMNIKSLYAICTAALLAGCTDLDVNIESQYTQYPINDIAVEAKNADVYFHLRDVFGRRYMEAMSLSSDEYTAVHTEEAGTTVVVIPIRAFTILEQKTHRLTGCLRLSAALPKPIR